MKRFICDLKKNEMSQFHFTIHKSRFDSWITIHELCSLLITGDSNIASSKSIGIIRSGFSKIIFVLTVSCDYWKYRWQLWPILTRIIVGILFAGMLKISPLLRRAISWYASESGALQGPVTNTKIT